MRERRHLNRETKIHVYERLKSRAKNNNLSTFLCLSLQRIRDSSEVSCRMHINYVLDFARMRILGTFSG